MNAAIGQTIWPRQLDRGDQEPLSRPVLTAEHAAIAIEAAFAMTGPPTNFPDGGTGSVTVTAPTQSRSRKLAAHAGGMCEGTLTDFVTKDIEISKNS
jgi:hypothetical protein